MPAFYSTHWREHKGNTTIPCYSQQLLKSICSGHISLRLLFSINAFPTFTPPQTREMEYNKCPHSSSAHPSVQGK